MSFSDGVSRRTCLHESFCESKVGIIGKNDAPIAVLSLSDASLNFYGL
jgi:hypothetical protein